MIGLRPHDQTEGEHAPPAPAKAGETQSAGKLRFPLSCYGLRLRSGLDPHRGLRPPNRLRGSAPLLKTA